MNTKNKLYQLKDYQIEVIKQLAAKADTGLAVMHIDVKKQNKSKDNQTKEQPC